MQYRAQRYPTHRAVHFYRIDELVAAEARDVSATGLFVRTEAWLPVNGVVDLAVTLPGGAHVVLPSRVAHCLAPDQASEVGRDGGIGFELLPGRRRDAALWREYVRSLGSDNEVHSDRVHRRLVLISQKRRLLERLVNALQDVALEVGFYDARAAVDEAGGETPDALVVDGALAGHVRVGELRELTGAPMLVLVRAEADAAAAWQAGADDVLVAPFDDAELSCAVARLDPQQGTPDMTGDLAAIEPCSVLNMLEYERRDGLLTLFGPGGAVRIRVRGGAIECVSGARGAGSGDALTRALGFTEGRFEFRRDRRFGAERRPEQVPLAERASISAVLMEYARTADERNRDSDN